MRHKTNLELRCVIDMAHFYPEELIKQFPGLSAIYDDDDENAEDGTMQDSQHFGETVSFLSYCCLYLPSVICTVWFMPRNIFLMFKTSSAV